ncbi:MAG: hypothetical protein HY820_32510 [Acidobacteria bacterium]|nr:hypothetical protein [Acidobacteriota bacterium]
MSHTVYYDWLELYSQASGGITIPVVLRSARSIQVVARAKVDTGAEYCVFSRIHAEYLELDVEAGTPLTLSTVAGSCPVFGHELTLVVMGMELHGTYYFFQDESIRKDVLGRNGWLNRVRIGVDDTGPTGLLYAARP